MATLHIKIVRGPDKNFLRNIFLFLFMYSATNKLKISVGGPNPAGFPISPKLTKKLTRIRKSKQSEALKREDKRTLTLVECKN